MWPAMFQIEFVLDDVVQTFEEIRQGVAAPIPITKSNLGRDAVKISVSPFLPELVMNASLWMHVLPFQIWGKGLVGPDGIGLYRIKFENHSKSLIFGAEVVKTCSCLGLVFRKTRKTPTSAPGKLPSLLSCGFKENVD